MGESAAVEDVTLRLPSQAQVVRAAAIGGEGTVEVAEVVVVLGGDVEAVDRAVVEVVLDGSIVEGIIG